MLEESTLERLALLSTELENVRAQLSDPDVYSDQAKARELSRRAKHLEPIVEAYAAYQSAQSDIDAARELIPESPAIDREELHQIITTSETALEDLSDRLRILLLPQDPNDDKNVIIEIRGAEGGEEANLFARVLADMYLRFADTKGWNIETISADPSERGGYNEVVFLVKGDGAWTHLKFEGGPHRVQRVPETESQGRVHTSSATVTVLPEAEEVDIEIDPNDLKIDVYRSSGPGGQSVNTTDSAVRITHIPTGVVVAMQDEKSQIQNRAKAMQVLRARLLKAKQDEQSAAMSSARKSQVGGGGRSEKIRTYNYKDNRVTDHRIGLTIYQLDRFLQGEMDEVIDALIADERTRLLSGEDA